MGLLDFADATDVSPPIDPDDPSPEFSCKVCARALTYSGRGRKPSKCSASNGGDPECFGSRAASTGRAPKASGEKLAADAVAVLRSVNDMVGMGALLAGFNNTASAMAAGQEGFRDKAFAALVLDPSLCRMILRAGTNSGKVALLMAYGMYLAPVAMTAYAEYSMRRLAEEKG